MTQQENDIEDDEITAQTLVAVCTSTDNNHTFTTHTNEIKQVLLESGTQETRSKFDIDFSGCTSTNSYLTYLISLLHHKVS